MALSIHERICRAEHDFLQAASTGHAALEAFQDAWSILFKDVQNASQTKSADDDTSATWHGVASRIATLSEYLVDVETSAQTLTSTFYGELDTILARVDLNDTSNLITPSASHLLETTPTNFQSSSSSSSTSSYASADSLNHPYIQEAYSWLLKNLHNPYPSKETRNMMCSKTGSSRTALDAWFIDARKRIGWNTLRRKHFSNKRVEIVEAATLFFVESTSIREPYPFINVDSEFASIEIRARGLYSEKHSESALASQLDSAIKDMTPEMKFQAKILENQRRREEREGKLHAEQSANAASSYPSPHLSPRLSPSPPLPSEDFNLLTVPSMSITGCKRTISSRSSPGYDIEYPGLRPNKRPRFDLTSDIVAAANSFPSPALSSNELLPTDERAIVSASPLLTPTLAPLVTSRKRRLSDADSQGGPKRPRNIFSGPRPHAVSDPLPSSTFSTWFDNHLSIPSAATIDQSDLFQTYDIEFYDYSRSITNASPSGTESTIDNCAEFALPSTSFSETLLLAPQQPSSSSNPPTNHYDYNELLCGSEDFPLDKFTQNDMNFPHISANPVFNAVLSEYNFTTPAPSDTVVIADPCATTSQNPMSNFDWIFPPLSHNVFDSMQSFGLCDNLEDSALTFQPHSLKMSSQAIVGNTAAHMSVGAEKAAKQRKLWEMKEATRRLEAEIAAS